MIDKTRPVCVTGATGFVASQLIKDLLERGYSVRGTVRSLKKKDAFAHLAKLEGASRLSFFEADLGRPESFDAAIQGCAVVMHTASPYSLSVKDAQRDLVDPAVLGTSGVLEACLKVPSVQRVIVTSSMAAITDEPESERVLTEADWNVKSTLTRNPYYYSKTMAERATWAFVTEKKPAFDVVVINPFLIVGPSLSPGLNTSNQIFVDLLAGKYPALMRLHWGFVDVRDVSDAHIRAMETPKASGRYICAGESAPMSEVVRRMRALGYTGKLPKLSLAHGMGDLAVKLLSYAQPAGVGDYIRTHIGRVPRYDTSKIRNELGVSFRSLDTSIADTLSDLVFWGHIPRAHAPGGRS